MVPKKSSPQELITYLCTRCTWDFARTELDKPKCTLCGKNDKLQEIKREPVTPQALEAAMMRSMDRLMTGLQGAYETHQAGHNQRGHTVHDTKNDDEEILLLETLVKAKNLEKHVGKAFGKSKPKKSRLHGISMSQ